MKKAVPFLWGIVLLLALFMGGCSLDTEGLFKSSGSEKTDLMKVEITFTDDQLLTGYVKSLGIEKGSTVYVGGSSLNYLYDQNGNIVGAFNYQRVLYMKIINESKTD